MIVLGIDPGPEHCGVAVYNTEARRVLRAAQGVTVPEAGNLAGSYAVGGGLVAIERVQSYGLARASLLRTSESVGWLHCRVVRAGGVALLLYRRDVLRVLDVSGKGNRYSLERRLIEMHGGSRSAAVGKKKAPGPLYGVAGNAWAALAVAVAAAEEWQG